MTPMPMDAEGLVVTGEPTMSGTVVAVRDERTSAVAARTDVAGTLSPMQLIQIALESKTPALELKELVALAEHVEERNARKAFFEALRRFQHACPPIKKNKTAKITTNAGSSYSYMYAELDEIERHVKPYLEAEGFAYSFDTAVEGNGVMLTNICTLRHIDGHAESSRFTLPTASKSAMTDQQRFSAANNFAKRQTLANVTGISITDKEVPDEEVDPTPISEDQATLIDDLIRELEPTRRRVRERFFKYMDVQRVDQILAADYEKALGALRAPEGKA